MVQNSRVVVGCCIVMVGLSLPLPVLRVMAPYTMGPLVDVPDLGIHGRSYVVCKDYSKAEDSRSFDLSEQEVALKVARMYRPELHHERA